MAPILASAGHELRILVRGGPERLNMPPFGPGIEVFYGDVLQEDSIASALKGVDAAYYLVHSMKGSAEGFQEQDRRAGQIFGLAAAKAGVNSVIYLGALGNPEADLTPHLRSRHQTGEALAESGIPVLELRTGPVIGAGSLPFEMIRYLTERVPIMVCPRWVYTLAQPIGVRDILMYLEASLHVPPEGHQVVEIGGSDVLTYGEMMLRYAYNRGLKRRMIRVPLLTPRLSSYWLDWVTPIRARYARPIVEGLRNEVIVRNDLAKTVFPGIIPIGYDSAIKEALAELHPDKLISSSLDKIPSSKKIIFAREHSRGMIIERRKISCDLMPEDLFDEVTKIGGPAGWYFDWAWRLRGAIDRVVGGIGLRRSTTIKKIKEGENLDFWHIEVLEPSKRLLLKAEMKLPGTAWLEFIIKLGPNNTSLLEQNSYFAPHGFLGLLYWYALMPIHTWIFTGMARELAAKVSRKE